MPRTACALVCSSDRAGLLSLRGLNTGVGVAQVVRGAAELHEVEGAVAPARVKRVGRRVGGAKSCRRRSPSCLAAALIPRRVGCGRAGTWASSFHRRMLRRGSAGPSPRAASSLGRQAFPAPGISCLSTCPVPTACQLVFHAHAGRCGATAGGRGDGRCSRGLLGALPVSGGGVRGQQEVIWLCIQSPSPTEGPVGCGP